MIEKVLYMCVTKDRYELPLAVDDSVVGLARLVGTSANTISSELSKEKAGKLQGKYKRIVVEYDASEVIP